MMEPLERLIIIHKIDPHLDRKHVLTKTSINKDKPTKKN